MKDCNILSADIDVSAQISVIFILEKIKINPIFQEFCVDSLLRER